MGKKRTPPMTEHSTAVRGARIKKHIMVRVTHPNIMTGTSRDMFYASGPYVSFWIGAK